MASPNPNRVESGPHEEPFELLGEPISNGRIVWCRARDRVTGTIGALHRVARESSGDSSTQQQLATESNAARSLDQQGLVRIHAAGVDAAGPFCFTEWIEGQSLAERLATGPIPEQEVLALALQGGAALAHAHEHGFALGNIAPEHVVIRANGVVTLVGLGASGLGAAPRDIARNDPYCDRGELGALRAPSVEGDLRSFGKLLFHAMTGEPPHTIALGLLPAWLADVVSRCFESGGDRRFRDARDLVRALGDSRRQFAESSALSTRTAQSRGGASGKAAETTLGLSISLAPELALAGTEPSKSAVVPQNERTPSGSSPFPWQPLHEVYEVDAGVAPMQGGMGAVLAARERSTGRRVAIKRIRSDMLGTGSAVARFHREAQSIARLSHPHVLSLLHCARDADGDFLVLEWAGGGSLRERLASNGKLPVAEVIAIARKIGSALAHAHSRGVIHRDIKPHNVLLTDDGEPRLADFGLARAAGDLTVTTSLAGAGTPLYIAPEQWRESRSADERSDLYSFGKMLYHLVTGDPPASIEPERLPVELRDPILGAVKDRPAERWSDVSRFLAELERSVARAQPRPRSRTLIAAAAFVIGALSIAFAFRDRLGLAPAPKSEPRASGTTEPGGTSKSAESAESAKSLGGPAKSDLAKTTPPSTTESVVKLDPQEAKPAPTKAPDPAPVRDATAPIVFFSDAAGGALADPIVTREDSVLVFAHATDDAGVASAKQQIARPDSPDSIEGSNPPSDVSPGALREGTSVEIPLATAGLHRVTLTAADPSGNTGSALLRVERHMAFPTDDAALFASLDPPPNRSLFSSKLPLRARLSPALAGAAVELVSVRGAAETPLGPLTISPELDLALDLAFAPGSTEVRLGLKVTRAFYDPRETNFVFTRRLGRSPVSDVSRFECVVDAAAEGGMQRRVRDTRTGIELILVETAKDSSGALLPPFYLGACEVSIAEYRAWDGAARSTGGATLGRDARSVPSSEARFDAPLPLLSEIEIEPTMPATFVSRDDAIAYCEALGYRLPDLTRFRAVARVFHDDSRCCNLASDEPNSLLRFGGEAQCDGWQSLAPAALFVANTQGFHALYGNVAEWLTDGGATNALAAGGSWTDFASSIQKSITTPKPAGTRDAWTGFRVMLVPN